MSTGLAVGSAIGALVVCALSFLAGYATKVGQKTLVVNGDEAGKTLANYVLLLETERWGFAVDGIRHEQRAGVIDGDKNPTVLKLIDDAMAGIDEQMADHIMEYFTKQKD